jgi:predicted pyridoxine 5'-phosphate oxidase superfamily flavin-nucleotide-binding protein
MFLIPGVGEMLRVNGTARISASPALRERFVADGKAPASVLVISVASVFFQCARAVKRSGLWDPARHVQRASLPSPGEILQSLSSSGIDGRVYDDALQARQAATLY